MSAAAYGRRRPTIDNNEGWDLQIALPTLMALRIMAFYLHGSTRCPREAHYKTQYISGCFQTQQVVTASKFSQKANVSHWKNSVSLEITSP
jgi:hypothetical protein